MEESNDGAKAILRSVALDTLVILAIAGTALQGCGNSTVDKDGVPVVDLHGTIVPPTEASAKASQQLGVSPHGTRKVTVGKEQITLYEFVRAYCLGKDFNATCTKAKTISAMDSTKGPVENLPKNL